MTVYALPWTFDTGIFTPTTASAAVPLLAGGNLGDAVGILLSYIEFVNNDATSKWVQAFNGSGQVVIAQTVLGPGESLWREFPWKPTVGLHTQVEEITLVFCQAWGWLQ